MSIDIANKVFLRKVKSVLINKSGNEKLHIDFVSLLIHSDGLKF